MRKHIIKTLLIALTICSLSITAFATNPTSKETNVAYSGLGG